MAIIDHITTNNSKCPSNAEFLNALALYSNYDD